MKKVISITDDFDLHKITGSGQCFRPVCLEDETYRFITGRHILYIRQIDAADYAISTDLDEWEKVWRHYFDLDTDYSAIRAQIPEDDEYMLKASEMGKGIRILNQDPFEMLISFIISQRRSIPSIRSCVEKICSFYGDRVRTLSEEVCLFPTALQLKEQGFSLLSQCSMGYRLPYVTSAVEDVISGMLDLDAIGELDDDTLLARLMDLHGVGIKVASCVALFAYGRGGIAPVDTWIQRVIDEHYNGNSPFPGYGKNSGIFQQYAFYRASSRLT